MVRSTPLPELLEGHGRRSPLICPTAQTLFNPRTDLRQITLAGGNCIAAQDALPLQTTKHSIDLIHGFERLVNLAKGVEVVEINRYDLAQ
jgi:hypothetical protein